MTRLKMIAAGLGLLAGVFLMLAPGTTGTAADKLRPAPEFPSLERSSWVGDPVSMESLRGHVVLLSVWTFG